MDKNNRINRVELNNVSLQYDGLEVLKNFILKVLDKEFLVILGPSGCGKTTLLNIISGYSKPSLGTVTYRGSLRTVFQQGSLYPWLTVYENISIGLNKRKDKTQNIKEVDEMISMVNLSGFNNHYPYQLSGGMKQRAELARVLIGHSDILLMDEPFSSLDYLTRLTLRNDLVKLLKEKPKTVILVTHDIEEAVHLANRIIVLSKNPSKIVKEIEIERPYPRKSDDPEIIKLISTIIELLGTNA